MNPSNDDSHPPPHHPAHLTKLVRQRQQDVSVAHHQQASIATRHFNLAPSLGSHPQPNHLDLYEPQIPQAYSLDKQSTPLPQTNSSATHSAIHPGNPLEPFPSFNDQRYHFHIPPQSSMDSSINPHHTFSGQPSQLPLGAINASHSTLAPRNDHHLDFSNVPSQQHGIISQPPLLISPGSSVPPAFLSNPFPPITPNSAPVDPFLKLQDETHLKNIQEPFPYVELAISAQASGNHPHPSMMATLPPLPSVSGLHRVSPGPIGPNMMVPLPNIVGTGNFQSPLGLSHPSSGYNPNSSVMVQGDYLLGMQPLPLTNPAGGAAFSRPSLPRIPGVTNPATIHQSAHTTNQVAGITTLNNTDICSNLESLRQIRSQLDDFTALECEYMEKSVKPNNTTQTTDNNTNAFLSALRSQGVDTQTMDIFTLAHFGDINHFTNKLQTPINPKRLIVSPEKIIPKEEDIYNGPSIRHNNRTSNLNIVTIPVNELLMQTRVKDDSRLKLLLKSQLKGVEITNFSISSSDSEEEAMLFDDATGNENQYNTDNYFYNRHPMGTGGSVVGKKDKMLHVPTPEQIARLKEYNLIPVNPPKNSDSTHHGSQPIVSLNISSPSTAQFTPLPSIFGSASTSATPSATTQTLGLINFSAPFTLLTYGIPSEDIPSSRTPEGLKIVDCIEVPTLTMPNLKRPMNDIDRVPQKFIDETSPNRFSLVQTSPTLPSQQPLLTPDTVELLLTDLEQINTFAHSIPLAHYYHHYIMLTQGNTREPFKNPPELPRISEKMACPSLNTPKDYYFYFKSLMKAKGYIFVSQYNITLPLDYLDNIDFSLINEYFFRKQENAKKQYQQLLAKQHEHNLAMKTAASSTNTNTTGPTSNPPPRYNLYDEVSNQPQPTADQAFVDEDDDDSNVQTLPSINISDLNALTFNLTEETSAQSMLYENSINLTDKFSTGSIHCGLSFNNNNLSLIAHNSTGNALMQHNVNVLTSYLSKLMPNTSKDSSILNQIYSNSYFLSKQDVCIQINKYLHQNHTLIDLAQHTATALKESFDKKIEKCVGKIRFIISALVARRNHSKLSINAATSVTFPIDESDLQIDLGSKSIEKSSPIAFLPNYDGKSNNSSICNIGVNGSTGKKVPVDILHSIFPDFTSATTPLSKYGAQYNDPKKPLYEQRLIHLSHKLVNLMKERSIISTNNELVKILLNPLQKYNIYKEIITFHAKLISLNGRKQQQQQAQAVVHANNPNVADHITEKSLKEKDGSTFSHDGIPGAGTAVLTNTTNHTAVQNTTNLQQLTDAQPELTLNNAAPVMGTFTTNFQNQGALSTYLTKHIPINIFSAFLSNYGNNMHINEYIDKYHQQQQKITAFYNKMKEIMSMNQHLIEIMTLNQTINEKVRNLYETQDMISFNNFYRGYLAIKQDRYQRYKKIVKIRNLQQTSKFDDIRADLVPFANNSDYKLSLFEDRCKRRINRFLLKQIKDEQATQTVFKNLSNLSDDTSHVKSISIASCHNNSKTTLLHHIAKKIKQNRKIHKFISIRNMNIMGRDATTAYLVHRYTTICNDEIPLISSQRQNTLSNYQGKSLYSPSVTHYQNSPPENIVNDHNNTQFSPETPRPFASTEFLKPSTRNPHTISAPTPSDPLFQQRARKFRQFYRNLHYFKPFINQIQFILADHEYTKQAHLYSRRRYEGLSDVADKAGRGSIPSVRYSHLSTLKQASTRPTPPKRPGLISKKQLLLVSDTRFGFLLNNAKLYERAQKRIQAEMGGKYHNNLNMKYIFYNIATHIYRTMKKAQFNKQIDVIQAYEIVQLINFFKKKLFSLNSIDSAKYAANRRAIIQQFKGAMLHYKKRKNETLLNVPVLPSRKSLHFDLNRNYYNPRVSNFFEHFHEKTILFLLKEQQGNYLTKFIEQNNAETIVHKMEQFSENGSNPDEFVDSFLSDLPTQPPNSSFFNVMNNLQMYTYLTFYCNFHNHSFNFFIPELWSSYKNFNKLRHVKSTIKNNATTWASPKSTITGEWLDDAEIDRRNNKKYKRVMKLPNKPKSITVQEQYHALMSHFYYHILFKNVNVKESAINTFFSLGDGHKSTQIPKSSNIPDLIFHSDTIIHNNIHISVQNIKYYLNYYLKSLYYSTANYIQIQDQLNKSSNNNTKSRLIEQINEKRDLIGYLPSIINRLNSPKGSQYHTLELLLKQYNFHFQKLYSKYQRLHKQHNETDFLATKKIAPRIIFLMKYKQVLLLKIKSSKTTSSQIVKQKALYNAINNGSFSFSHLDHLYTQHSSIKNDKNNENVNQFDTEYVRLLTLLHRQRGTYMNKIHNTVQSSNDNDLSTVYQKYIKQLHQLNILALLSKITAFTPSIGVHSATPDCKFKLLQPIAHQDQNKPHPRSILKKTKSANTKPAKRLQFFSDDLVRYQHIDTTTAEQFSELKSLHQQLLKENRNDEKIKKNKKIKNLIKTNKMKQIALLMQYNVYFILHNQDYLHQILHTHQKKHIFSFFKNKDVKLADKLAFLSSYQTENNEKDSKYQISPHLLETAYNSLITINDDVSGSLLFASPYKYIPTRSCYEIDPEIDHLVVPPSSDSISSPDSTKSSLLTSSQIIRQKIHSSLDFLTTTSSSILYAQNLQSKTQVQRQEAEEDTHSFLKVITNGSTEQFSPIHFNPAQQHLLLHLQRTNTSLFDFTPENIEILVNYYKPTLSLLSLFLPTHFTTQTALNHIEDPMSLTKTNNIPSKQYSSTFSGAANVQSNPTYATQLSRYIMLQQQLSLILNPKKFCNTWLLAQFSLYGMKMQKIRSRKDFQQQFNAPINISSHLLNNFNYSTFSIASENVGHTRGEFHQKEDSNPEIIADPNKKTDAINDNNDYPNQDSDASQNNEVNKNTFGNKLLLDPILGKDAITHYLPDNIPAFTINSNGDVCYLHQYIDNYHDLTNSYLNGNSNKNMVANLANSIPQQLKVGTNVLHWAVDGGSFQLINYLTNNLSQSPHQQHLPLPSDPPAFPQHIQESNVNININQFNNTFNTPLHLALMNKHINIVYLLLQLGADPWIMNKNTGMTALHYAMLHHSVQAVPLLLQHVDDLEFGHLFQLDLYQHEQKFTNNDPNDKISSTDSTQSRFTTSAEGNPFNDQVEYEDDNKSLLQIHIYNRHYRLIHHHQAVLAYYATPPPPTPQPTKPSGKMSNNNNGTTTSSNPLYASPITSKQCKTPHMIRLLYHLPLERGFETFFPQSLKKFVFLHEKYTALLKCVQESHNSAGKTSDNVSTNNNIPTLQKMQTMLKKKYKSIKKLKRRNRSDDGHNIRKGGLKNNSMTPSNTTTEDGTTSDNESSDWRLSEDQQSSDTDDYHPYQSQKSNFEEPSDSAEYSDFIDDDLIIHSEVETPLDIDDNTDDNSLIVKNLLEPLQDVTFSVLYGRYQWYIDEIQLFSYKNQTNIANTAKNIKSKDQLNPTIDDEDTHYNMNASRNLNLNSLYSSILQYHHTNNYIIENKDYITQLYRMKGLPDEVKTEKGQQKLQPGNKIGVDEDSDEESMLFSNEKYQINDKVYDFVDYTINPMVLFQYLGINSYYNIKPIMKTQSTADFTPADCANKASDILGYQNIINNISVCKYCCNELGVDHNIGGLLHFHTFSPPILHKNEQFIVKSTEIIEKQYSMTQIKGKSQEAIQNVKQKLILSCSVHTDINNLVENNDCTRELTDFKKNKVFNYTKNPILSAFITPLPHYIANTNVGNNDATVIFNKEDKLTNNSIKSKLQLNQLHFYFSGFKLFLYNKFISKFVIPPSKPCELTQIREPTLEKSEKKHDSNPSPTIFHPELITSTDLTNNFNIYSGANVNTNTNGVPNIAEFVMKSSNRGNAQIHNMSNFSIQFASSLASFVSKYHKFPSFNLKSMCFCSCSACTASLYCCTCPFTTLPLKNDDFDKTGKQCRIGSSHHHHTPEEQHVINLVLQYYVIIMNVYKRYQAAQKATFINEYNNNIDDYKSQTTQFTDSSYFSTQSLRIKSFLQHQYGSFRAQISPQSPKILKSLNSFETQKVSPYVHGVLLSSTSKHSNISTFCNKLKEKICYFNSNLSNKYKMYKNNLILNYGKLHSNKPSKKHSDSVMLLTSQKFKLYQQIVKKQQNEISQALLRDEQLSFSQKTRLLQSNEKDNAESQPDDEINLNSRRHLLPLSDIILLFSSRQHSLIPKTFSNGGNSSDLQQLSSLLSLQTSSIHEQPRLNDHHVDLMLLSAQNKLKTAQLFKMKHEITSLNSSHSSRPSPRKHITFGHPPSQQKFAASKVMFTNTPSFSATDTIRQNPLSHHSILKKNGHVEISKSYSPHFRKNTSQKTINDHSAMFYEEIIRYTSGLLSSRTDNKSLNSSVLNQMYYPSNRKKTNCHTNVLKKIHMLALVSNNIQMLHLQRGSSSNARHSHIDLVNSLVNDQNLDDFDYSESMQLGTVHNFDANKYQYIVDYLESHYVSSSTPKPSLAFYSKSVSNDHVQVEMANNIAQHTVTTYGEHNTPHFITQYENFYGPRSHNFLKSSSPGNPTRNVVVSLNASIVQYNMYLLWNYYQFTQYHTATTLAQFKMQQQTSSKELIKSSQNVSQLTKKTLKLWPIHDLLHKYAVYIQYHNYFTFLSRTNPIRTTALKNKHRFLSPVVHVDEHSQRRRPPSESFHYLMHPIEATPRERTLEHEKFTASLLSRKINNMKNTALFKVYTNNLNSIVQSNDKKGDFKENNSDETFQMREKFNLYIQVPKVLGKSINVRSNTVNLYIDPVGNTPPPNCTTSNYRTVEGTPEKTAEDITDLTVLPLSQCNPYSNQLTYEEYRHKLKSQTSKVGNIGAASPHGLSSLRKSDNDLFDAVKSDINKSSQSTIGPVKTYHLKELAALHQYEFRLHDSKVRFISQQFHTLRALLESCISHYNNLDLNQKLQIPPRYDDIVLSTLVNGENGSGSNLSAGLTRTVGNRSIPASRESCDLSNIPLIPQLFGVDKANVDYIQQHLSPNDCTHALSSTSSPSTPLAIKSISSKQDDECLKQTLFTKIEKILKILGSFEQYYADEMKKYGKKQIIFQQLFLTRQNVSPHSEMNVFHININQEPENNTVKKVEKNKKTKKINLSKKQTSINTPLTQPQPNVKNATLSITTPKTARFNPSFINYLTQNEIDILTTANTQHNTHPTRDHFDKIYTPLYYSAIARNTPNTTSIARLPQYKKITHNNKRLNKYLNYNNLIRTTTQTTHSPEAVYSKQLKSLEKPRASEYTHSDFELISNIITNSTSTNNSSANLLSLLGFYHPKTVCNRCGIEMLASSPQGPAQGVMTRILEQRMLAAYPLIDAFVKLARVLAQYKQQILVLLYFIVNMKCLCRLSNYINGNTYDFTLICTCNLTKKDNGNVTQVSKKDRSQMKEIIDYVKKFNPINGNNVYKLPNVVDLTEVLEMNLNQTDNAPKIANDVIITCSCGKVHISISFHSLARMNKPNLTGISTKFNQSQLSNSKAVGDYTFKPLMTTMNTGFNPHINSSHTNGIGIADDFYNSDVFNGFLAQLGWDSLNFYHYDQNIENTLHKDTILHILSCRIAKVDGISVETHLLNKLRLTGPHLTSVKMTLFNVFGKWFNILPPRFDAIIAHNMKNNHNSALTSPTIAYPPSTVYQLFKNKPQSESGEIIDDNHNNRILDLYTFYFESLLSYNYYSTHPVDSEDAQKIAAMAQYIQHYVNELKQSSLSSLNPYISAIDNDTGSGMIIHYAKAIKLYKNHQKQLTMDKIREIIAESYEATLQRSNTLPADAFVSQCVQDIQIAIEKIVNQKLVSQREFAKLQKSRYFNEFGQSSDIIDDTNHINVLDNILTQNCSANKKRTKNSTQKPIKFPHVQGKLQQKKIVNDQTGVEMTTFSADSSSLSPHDKKSIFSGFYSCNDKDLSNFITQLDLTTTSQPLQKHQEKTLLFVSKQLKQRIFSNKSPPKANVFILSTKSPKVQLFKQYLHNSLHNQYRNEFRLRHQLDTVSSSDLENKKNQAKYNITSNSYIFALNVNTPCQHAMTSATSFINPQQVYTTLQDGLFYFNTNIVTMTPFSSTFTENNPITQQSALDLEYIQRLYNLYWTIYQTQKLLAFLSLYYNPNNHFIPPSVEYILRRNKYGLHSHNLAILHDIMYQNTQLSQIYQHLSTSSIAELETRLQTFNALVTAHQKARDTPDGSEHLSQNGDKLLANKLFARSNNFTTGTSQQLSQMNTLLWSLTSYVVSSILYNDVFTIAPQSHYPRALYRHPPTPKYLYGPHQSQSTARPMLTYSQIYIPLVNRKEYQRYGQRTIEIYLYCCGCIIQPYHEQPKNVDDTASSGLISSHDSEYSNIDPVSLIFNNYDDIATNNTLLSSSNVTVSQITETIPPNLSSSAIKNIFNIVDFHQKFHNITPKAAKHTNSTHLSSFIIDKSSRNIDNITSSDEEIHALSLLPSYLQTHNNAFSMSIDDVDRYENNIYPFLTNYMHHRFNLVDAMNHESHTSRTGDSSHETVESQDKFRIPDNEDDISVDQHPEDTMKTTQSCQLLETNLSSIHIRGATNSEQHNCKCHAKCHVTHNAPSKKFQHCCQPIQIMVNIDYDTDDSCLLTDPTTIISLILSYLAPTYALTASFNDSPLASNISNNAQATDLLAQINKQSNSKFGNQFVL